MGGDHQIVQVIVRDFEALSALLERTIDALANGGTSEGVNIEALRRAKGLVLQGAELTRSALPEDHERETK